jgi:hypothetical protein
VAEELEMMETPVMAVVAVAVAEHYLMQII